MTTPADDEIRRIYQATLDDLYGFVSRRCGGDRDLAEDVTQEVWLRAVRAWADDGIPNRPRAWLTTVAGRLLLNHFRRPDVSRLDRDALDGLGAPDADAGRAATARRSLVERALARLPRPQAWLLEAFHLDQRATRDIAAHTGLTERAVEGRLRRARNSLRNEIESEGELP